VEIVLTTCTIPNALALTFDDGPGQSTTDILNTLARLQVNATFFVNSKNIADLTRVEDAAQVKRTFDAGHQIASHTYSHADLTNLDDAGIKGEMDRIDVLLKGIIG
jgi:peptidoglycan/xylan/chitin deacetylase (PgdA/CDA1 family)